MKVRIIRGETSANAQHAAWASLDTPAGNAPAAVPLPKEPQVELMRQSDGANKIIVTCTCGKRVEITCE